MTLCAHRRGKLKFPPPVLLSPGHSETLCRPIVRSHYYPQGRSLMKSDVAKVYKLRLTHPAFCAPNPVFWKGSNVVCGLTPPPPIYISAPI